MAPQVLENTESAPEKTAVATAVPARQGVRTAAGAGRSGETPEMPAASPPCDPSPAPASSGGVQTAPQTIEKIESAPEVSTPAAAEADGAASPSDTDVSGLEPPPPAPIEPPPAAEWREHVATLLAPDSAGGFRRMTIRFLRNGVAAG